MKKVDFVTLAMSTIGGALFALGMCMCLIQDWESFDAGVVMGAVGAVVLLAMVVVRRRDAWKAGNKVERQSGRHWGSGCGRGFDAGHRYVHGHGLGGHADRRHYCGTRGHSPAALAAAGLQRVEVNSEVWNGSDAE